MDDYLALWSDLLTKPEATLSEQLVALTRDDVFAPLVGKQLLLAVHARELLGERISHALSAANLPTKTELAAINERLASLEDGVASVQAYVTRLEKRLSRADSVVAPMPKRPSAPSRTSRKKLTGGML
jgi:hypothetical protein